MRTFPLVLAAASVLMAQTFEDIQVERISNQFSYLDGLVWAKEGYLLAADVVSKKLMRFDPGEKVRVVREDDGGVEGVAADIQGRIYMCEAATRRVTRMDRRGKVESLAERFEGKKFNAPNDIAVRRDGHVYFTDPAFGSAQDVRELDFYGIFHIGLKGEVEVVARWKTRPNGIALTQDGKVLFVGDSDTHAVAAFDLDKNGAASNERILIKGIEGVPGGIRTDVQGRLYVAARNLEIFSPQGKPLHTIQLAEPATNCAFGDDGTGKGTDALFIATRKGLYRAGLHVKGAFQY